MAVAIAYVYAHKPFTSEQLLSVFTALWRIIIAFSILSLAGGIGMLLPVKYWDLPPHSIAMIAASLGIGVLGIFILILSITLGTGKILWILYLFFLGIFWKQIISWLILWKKQSFFSYDSSRIGKVFIIPILIILFYQLFKTLAPPLNFDALTYHLALPKLYILNGRLIYTADNIFWGMPQLIEMLYVLAMSLGGAEAAVILGWFIGLVTLLGLADTIKALYGENSAWATVACFFVSAGMTNSLSSGYIEWASIMYGTATLISLHRWLSNQDTLGLFFSGIFAGLAISTKYTNGIILVAGIVSIAMLYRPASWTRIVQNIALFSIVAVTTLIPWLIKNFIATLNPFYPLFLPSGGMNEILLNFYQFKPATQDWSLLIFLPIKATILGMDGSEGFSSSIGPLFLALSPFAWINWRGQSIEQRTFIKLGGVTLITGFIIWAIGSQFRGLLIQTRLYFSLFPAWSLLAAAGYKNIGNFRTDSVRFGSFAGAITLLFLMFNTFSTVADATISNPLSAILIQGGRANYLQRRLGDYAIVMQQIDSLPSSTKTIMLWETRSFSCLPKCDPDEIIGRWYNDWSMYHNANQVIESWKKQGYTHVLLNQAGADFIQKFDKNSPPKEYWNGLIETINLLTPIESLATTYKFFKLP